MKPLHRLLLAALLGAGLAAGAATPAPAPLGDWLARLDTLVDQAYERPDAAAAVLAGLEAGAAASPAHRRSLTLAQGLVAARAGRAPVAEAAALALHEMALPVDAMADADAALVLGLLDEQRGRTASAAEHALTATIGYESLCGGAAGAPREDCDHRSAWRALQLLATTAAGAGNLVAARQHLARADALAERAGDTARRALSLSHQAIYSELADDPTLARRQLALAQRLAAAHDDAALRVRLALNGALVALHAEQPEAVRRAIEEALPLARQAGLARFEAVLLANLSDLQIKRGRPADALAAVERALPAARRHDDQRVERVLLHNATLARIGLGRLSEARRDLDRLLALWTASGGAGEQATALREFGHALQAAGDVRGALELYHRERKLAADIMAANREASVRELRNRYDREAQQRNIELLERDNAIKGTQLTNQALRQRIWALLAVTLALAAAMVVLLVRRMRETQRRLEQSHAWLRVQSERDPLTGLANRRHFQDVMRARGGHLAFEGALMLVDIDHFKRVNDGRGHAAGDQVLVEVARRLNEAVRGGDLVVRWGGEEFLVFAPGVAGAALDQLAARVLHMVADQPVALDGAPLPVTVSIGYAGFPLSPLGESLTWEQAVNLADMALYTAKNQGRHRAVGIAELLAAAQGGAVQAAEADFERACQDGRVRLRVTAGAAPALA